MEFRILGPLEMWRDGATVSLGGPRQQAVLAVLLLRANQMVSLDRLIEEVWPGDPPNGAANTLHGYVFHLRKALEPDRPRGATPEVLISEPGGYRLCLSPDAIDAARFERLADQGRRLLLAGDAAGAECLVGEALELWRDVPLSAFADIESVRVETTRLIERRLGATEDRVEALLATGDAAAALAEIDSVIPDHPWHERIWAQRMLGLYRSGRQSDALDAYEEIRVAMRDELGLEPGPELRSMHTRILDQDATLDQPIAVSRPRLGRAEVPVPANELLGRTADIARVLAGLAAARLVTIIGPGGVGKTRLAIEALRQSGTDLGRTWFVDLAAIDDGALVESVVADAVTGGTGADLSSVSQQVIDTVGTIVLDNGEHVVADAADVVSRLLSRCPNLRILVTTREALAVDGEQLVALAPLGVPGADFSGTPDEARSFSAVELFEARARANRREFDLGRHLDAVVEVCRALDGIPLALELAAARLRSLTVEELAARIHDRFRILTGGPRTRVSRQQTLEAAVAWSHDLLDDLERAAYARLSVFSDGFVLAAAEAVLPTDPIDIDDVVDLLGHLVDKSLLIMDFSSGRYRMLETIRSYAAGRLAEDPATAAATRDRHARWCADFVGRHARDLSDGAEPDTIRAVDAEAANLRAAVEWTLGSDDTALAIQLAADLGPWWELRGRLTEGRSAIERALEGEHGDDETRLRARLALGFIARRQGDHEAASDNCQAALDGFRALGLPEHLAHALGRMAWVALGAGDTDHAVALAREGLALAEQTDDVRIAPWMHLGLGHAAHHRGNADEAIALFVEAREGFARSGSRTGLGRALFHLAVLGLERGDLPGARSAAVEAIETTYAGHDVNGMLMAAEVLAQVASAAGDHATATMLLAATASTRSSIGAHDHSNLPRLDTVAAAARAGLDPEELERATDRGGRLDLDRLAEEARAYSAGSA